MDNLKRRDFLKMVGIAVIAPTALLKAKITQFIPPEGEIDIGLEFPKGRINYWNFLNQEWTIQFDPLNVNFMKYLDECNYITISRTSN